MSRQIFSTAHSVLKELIRREQQHPYTVSFIISLFLTALIVFYTPPGMNPDEITAPPEYIKFIDISNYEFKAPLRIVKKEISAENGDVSADNSVDRARGVSDAVDAVDLSYYPNIVPPRPIGNLMKRYPKIARKMNIEARLNLELLILTTGEVRQVKVVGISLSKELPENLKKKITRAFVKEAVIILKNARFTPPLVEGKPRPVKMDMPLRFRLE